jgi:hypothetical protein
VAPGRLDECRGNGQLSVVRCDAARNQGAKSTTLHGFTLTTGVIIGRGGTVRVGSEVDRSEPFDVLSDDGKTVLRDDEPAGRRVEGLFFEAAEVARCIAAGRRETPSRSLLALLDPLRQWA